MVMRPMALEMVYCMMCTAPWSLVDDPLMSVSASLVPVNNQLCVPYTSVVATVRSIAKCPPLSSQHR